MFGVDEKQTDAVALIGAELARLRKPGSNWTQAGLVLILSVFLFSAAGAFGEGMTWPFLGALVVVIFVHEMGHLAAMWWFDYQDLRMFFIPFFGAAASGRKRTATAVQRAIVSLMGPLPGIAIGSVLGVLWLGSGSSGIGLFAGLFLALNLFNLLPLQPLDGGRLFDTILFSRWPRWQLVVNLSTGVALSAGGFALGDWIIGGLGVLLLLSSRSRYRVTRLGHALRQELSPDQKCEDCVPESLVEPLAQRVRSEFLTGSAAAEPRTIAGYLDQVWESVHQEPPRLAASLLLMTMYGATLFGLLVVALGAVFVSYDETIVSRVANGQETRTLEVSFLGQRLSEVALDESGSFHGPYLQYGPEDEPLISGNWNRGYREGTWSQLDPEGHAIAEASFAGGAFQSGRVLIDGAWFERSFEELPLDLQSSLEARQLEPYTATGVESDP